MGGRPVAHPTGQLGVVRASELLRAEALGHLARELRDVTLLGRFDEDSLGAERLQRRCNVARVKLSGSIVIGAVFACYAGSRTSSVLDYDRRRLDVGDRSEWASAISRFRPAASQVDLLGH